MSDKGTFAELLKDRPKRGRPRHTISRQSVYVALSDELRAERKALAKLLPKGLSRADIPDLAVTLLSLRLEQLQQAVAHRNRQIPEGIIDLSSLYSLWDLPSPKATENAKWTSVRLSPPQVVDLGRIQGMFNALFNSNRSDVFCLGLSLLSRFLRDNCPSFDAPITLSDMQREMEAMYRRPLR